MRRAPLRRAGVLTALAAGAIWLSPASGQAPPGAERLCEGGSDAVVKKGRWTLFEQPEGLGKITAHAAGGGGKLILVTDGRVVMRSTDRGCSWSESFSVQTPSVEGIPGADGNLPEVARLALLPESDSALMVLEGVGRAALSRLLHSGEGGRAETWTEAEGLPPVAGFREIVPAPDNGEIVYLTAAYGPLDEVGANDPAGATGPLYASADGGRTWDDMGRGAPIDRLAVEPDTGGQYLWAARADGQLQYSDDFGATWETKVVPPADDAEHQNALGQDAPPPPDHWRDVAVHRLAHTEHVVVATASPTKQADVTRAVVSGDRGRSWDDIATDGLGPAGGLLFGNGRLQIFSSVPTDSTAYRGPGLLEYNLDEKRWQGVDDLGLTSLKDPRAVLEPQAGAPRYRAVWVRRDRPDPSAPDLIARFEPDPPPTNLPSLAGRPNCGDPSAGRLPVQEVSFEPEALNLGLVPGQPARAELTATLGAAPTPLDVMFLLDHSDSMDPAVEGLFCSIERLVKVLPERNLETYFGLAAYNDMQTWTYRRLLDIQPPETAGPALTEALKGLRTRGGVHEPLRSALFQLATGAGMDMVARGPSTSPRGTRVPRKVEPGQQANWRESDKVLRTAIVITDEPYEEDTDGEPALSQVVEALRAKKVRVIGIRVIPYSGEAVRPTGDHTPQRQLRAQLQLQELARETGALAPRGGVDCDGGGTPDIEEGDPVVCSVREDGLKKEMDDTLVSVFQSLAGEDRRRVRLVPAETDGLSVQVEGPEPEVDVRTENELRSTAVVSCTEDQAGKVFDISFHVMVGEKAVGSLPGKVQCGDLPAGAVPPPPRAKKDPPESVEPPEPQPVPAPPTNPVPAPAPFQAPQPAVAAAPPPPPPAPAPISSAPVQASAPAGAQAAAPQVGAAAQEDREVAVKLATADGGHSGASDYEMVAVRQRMPVPLEALVTLGVGLSAFFVFLAASAVPRRHRRRAVEPALVSARDLQRRRR